MRTQIPKGKQIADLQTNEMENDHIGKEPYIDTVPVKRRLGFFSGVSIIVGSIIGSGIFVSPKGVLVNSGSVGLCLIIWFVCGLISALGAVIYAELGLLIPRSGGDFNYLLNVFGTFPAFMFAWCQFLIMPSSSAVLSLTLAEYFSKVIFDDCGPNNMILKLFACAVIISTGIINCISVKLSARTHILFTVLKVAGLLMIIIGGLVKILKGEFGSMSSGFEGSSTNPTSIAMAIYSGMFTYGGWQNLNHVLEELDNPKRNLPLCVITSITLVTVIYSLVNISYFSVLSKDEFLSSWAVAVTWAKYEISSAVVIIPIIVACSSYGTLTIAFFISSRLSFAAARAGLFPEILSYLNVNSNVPVPSTILIVMLSVVMTIPADIGMIINVISFIFWIFLGVNMVAFMVLRYKMKDVKTSIKVPLILPFILLMICIFLVVAPFLEPVRTEFWYALGYLVLGAILYIPFVLLHFRLPGIDGVTKFCQSLMIVAPATKPDEIS